MNWFKVNVVIILRLYPLCNIGTYISF